MDETRRFILGSIAALVGGTVVRTQVAHAASARRIERELRSGPSNTVLATAQGPRAGQARQGDPGVSEHPQGRFGDRGQGGDGALKEGNKTVGYYNIAAASFGLQAGAQTFSYALFFMTNSALKYLENSDGWSIGSGPSVVVLDKGAAASVTSTTLTQDVYAIPFGQRGLMAGIGLEGVQNHASRSIRTRDLEHRHRPAGRLSPAWA